MIAVKPRDSLKVLFEKKCLSLDINRIYYIDEDTLQFKNTETLEPVADVYSLKTKEGRVGILPVEWFISMEFINNYLSGQIAKGM